MIPAEDDLVRLLVVEDELRMAALLRRGLEEEGYAVDVAADGIQGLWQAGEYDYDAIVLDGMLPGLDGSRCAGVYGRRAGGLRCCCSLPATGCRAGCGGWMRALLRRGRPERPTVLVVGDLELDPASRTVSRGGRHLELTNKEFSLLELLMRHPGQVFSRDRILEHVWDLGYDPASNVVDQYVAYLRRKVESL